VANVGSGNGLASLLIGCGGVGHTTTPVQRIKNWYIGLFIYDQIKFKKLTVNTGVSWECDQPRVASVR
jgi:hypothetical protein